MTAFVRSEEHTILYNLLSAAAPGEFITYVQMREATGRKVVGAYGPLQSVLHRLLKEDGFLFKNEPGKGYRRLTPSETVDASNRDRGELHRHAKRNGNKLATAEGEFMTLDLAHRLRYCTAMSLYQAITAATTKQATLLLEKQIKHSDMRPLPFKETLQAFMPPKPKEE